MIRVRQAETDAGLTVPREDANQAFLQLEHELHRSLDVARCALGAAADLMDHDI